MLSETPGAHNPPSLKVISLLAINIPPLLVLSQDLQLPPKLQPGHTILLTIAHLPPNAVFQLEQSVQHKLLLFRLYFVILQHLNFNSQPCINILRELEIEIQARSQGNKQIPVLDAELQHITDP